MGERVLAFECPPVSQEKLGKVTTFYRFILLNSFYLVS